MKAGELHKILPWLLIAVQLCLLVFFAFNRLVDGDEGFYLSAAREVAQGRTLYADFFYPQMPYLPHIFSVFADHGFTTLFLTRLASVLVGILTTAIFYLLLKKFISDRTTINIILAMYVFSGLVISWHSVAKTFAWTDFFLMGAFYFLAGYLRNRKMWQLAGCGALMALAANTRLVLIPLIPIFYVAIMSQAGKEAIKRTIAYVVPLLLFSLPSFHYLIQDTKRFMFNNLGFHFIRNPGVEFPYSLVQRLSVLGKLLINPQILILLLVVITAYVYLRQKRDESESKSVFASPVGLAGITGLVMTIVYFMPNPVHQHYFVQVIPFALLAAAPWMEHFVSRIREVRTGIFNPRWSMIIMAIYILGILPYFVVYIGGVRDFDGHRDIANMKRISACLNQTSDKDPVLSEMPIVSVLANKSVVEGVEFLGFEYPLPLDTEEMRYYRLVLYEDLKKILDNRMVSYYIVVNDPPPALLASTKANYLLYDTFEKFKVYRRKS
jgi:4-amino-4-deoxy-L-arabinose transferase-like glycosyltransferase